MTTKTVTAMFDSYDDASKAVSRLESAGIAHSDISIVSNDATKRGSHADAAKSTDHPDAGPGAGTGATVGTALGGGAGLLAGLGLLAIPGLGPVVAAGWLAATLVGAGAGAATGGIVGALTGAGIDEAHAHSYAEGINRGGTLVTVRADESRLAQVTDILDDDGTIDMNERETSWRQGGWAGRYAGSESASAATAPMMAPSAERDAPVSHGATGSGVAGMGIAGLGAAGAPVQRPDDPASARTRVRTYPLS